MFIVGAGRQQSTAWTAGQETRRHRGVGDLGGTEEWTTVRRRAAGQVRWIHYEESQVADERLAQGEEDAVLLVLMRLNYYCALHCQRDIERCTYW